MRIGRETKKELAEDGAVLGDVKEGAGADEGGWGEGELVLEGAKTGNRGRINY